MEGIISVSFGHFSFMLTRSDVRMNNLNDKSLYINAQQIQQEKKEPKHLLSKLMSMYTTRPISTQLAALFERQIMGNLQPIASITGALAAHEAIKAVNAHFYVFDQNKKYISIYGYISV